MMNDLYGQYQQILQNGNVNDYGMPWVYGLNGAKAYPVRWGTRVAMMDAEAYPAKLIVYIKGVDISGVPLPIKTYELHEIQEQAAPKTNEESDLSKIMKRLDGFEKRLSELQKRSKPMNDQRRNRNDADE